MEETKIRQAYETMYEGMLKKDEAILEDVLDDSFVLVHMTGMRQDRTSFINAVKQGTLNYYSAVHEEIEVKEQGDEAFLIGKTYVLAAVFGGGKNYWHLRQDCHLKKKNGEWKITLAEASTY